MNDALYTTTTAIIDHAQLLLHEGDLNEKQRGFVKIILANAEKFIHIAAEFQSASIETISSEMRHTLGNPLTPINGYSELLAMGLMGTLNPMQQAHVETIWDLTTDLRQLVEMIVQEAREHAAMLAATG